MKAAGTEDELKAQKSGSWSPRSVALLRDVLVAVLLALLVATPLVIGDTAARGGYGTEVYPPIVLFMAWILLFVGWSVMGLLARRVVWHWGWIDTMVAVMLAWIVLSSLEMAWRGNPRAVIDITWRWVVLGIAYFLMRQMLDQPLFRRAAVATMLGTATLLSTHGFYQYSYDMPQARAAYQANPEEELERQGLDPTPGSRQRELFENRLNSPEPLATFALTNSLAGFLAPWLVMAAGLLAVNWRNASLRPLLPIGLGAVLLLGGGCLLLTQSRSGYLAVSLGLVAVGLGAFGLKVNRKVLLGLVGLVPLLVATAGGFMLAGGLKSELVSGAPSSVLYRLEYWQSTAAMIADYPLLGCGVGNFQSYYMAYKLPQASETIADPHNFLLELWASAGTPAVVCLLAAIALLTLRFARPVAAETEQDSEKLDAAESNTLRAAKGRRRQSEAEVAEPLPPPDTRVLAVGVVLGPAAGWVLGLCGSFPPELVGLLLGWPVLVVVVWLLRGWVLEGRLPAWLAAVAAGALLVHLLAAGGISFPSVAISLWLLAAVAVGATSPRDGRLGGLGTSGLIFGAALAMGVAYLVTAYWPPLTSFSQVASGDSMLTMDAAYLPEGEEAAAEAIEEYRKRSALEFYGLAANSDRYSPVPWQRIAGLSHREAVQYSLYWLQAEAERAEQAGQSTGDENLDAYQAAAAADERKEQEELLSGIWNQTLNAQKEVLARDRHSAQEFRSLGTWLLECHFALGDTNALNDALVALERSVELYPADSVGQAALAWAYHLAGREEEAAVHAAEALRLDDLNPHEDRDLARQNLYLQIEGIPEDSPLRLAPAEGNPREWMEALATPPASTT